MLKIGDARLPKRFWAKVALVDSGCWLWVAGQARGGYGKYSLQGRSRISHRVAYTALVGPVPEGLQLDHLCRVRACCNPAHLRIVTNHENMLAPGSLTFQAKNKAKTKCPKGHLYSAENTYKYKGQRHCIECKRVNLRSWRARHANS